MARYVLAQVAEDGEIVAVHRDPHDDLAGLRKVVAHISAVVKLVGYRIYELTPVPDDEAQ